VRRPRLSVEAIAKWPTRSIPPCGSSARRRRRVVVGVLARLGVPRSNGGRGTPTDTYAEASKPSRVGATPRGVFAVPAVPHVFVGQPRVLPRPAPTALCFFATGLISRFFGSHV